MSENNFPKTALLPHLLNAYITWLDENNDVAYLIVDITVDGLIAPIEYAHNDTLVLNVSPRAVRYFSINDEAVEFEASFGGMVQNVLIPLSAVIAIYGRDSMQGQLFVRANVVKLGSLNLQSFENLPQDSLIINKPATKQTAKKIDENSIKKSKTKLKLID